jgi:hypothetical protein
LVFRDGEWWQATFYGDDEDDQQNDGRAVGTSSGSKTTLRAGQ